MGVIYEHWRTDLNVCFYVGMSYAQPETRPYDLSPRNPYHGNVVNFLNENKLPIDVRIVDASHLSRKELGELETLQIAYFRDLVGELLTNIAPGGDGVVEWTDEMRQNLRNTQITLHKSPEGELIRQKMSAGWEEFLLSDEGKEWCIAKSDNLLRFFQTERGKNQVEDLKIKLDVFWNSDAGKVTREKERLRQTKQMEELLSSPEGVIWRKKLSDIMNSFLLTKEGMAYCQNMSEIKLNLYQSEKGKILIEDDRQRKLYFWRSDEGDKAKQYNREWMEDFYSGELGMQRKEENAKKVREAWQRPDVRWKMMFRDWHSANVRDKFYWGA